jgi:lipopolysaccharide transport system permease protein
MKTEGPTRVTSIREGETTSPASPVGETRALPETLIEAEPGWKVFDFRELWRYRELVGILAWRDVKVRYKQTILGAAWAVLQPTLMMIVFTFALGQRPGVSTGDIPYPLFVFAGLLPWSFFATAIVNSSTSVVESERLITKVYFPRLAIPFASAGAALVDFAVAHVVLLALMLWYGIAPSWTLLCVPAVAALVLLAALGVGALLAALNVAYRDFRYIVPFLVQLWMFATPAIYVQADTVSAPEKGASAIPSGVASWFQFNPMSGLVASFRAAVLGGPLPWHELALSATLAIAFFLVGCYYFRLVEDRFADII